MRSLEKFARDLRRLSRNPVPFSGHVGLYEGGSNTLFITLFIRVFDSAAGNFVS